MLGDQIWLSTSSARRPDPSRLRSVTSAWIEGRDKQGFPAAKPSAGGMWTSSYDSDHVSGWARTAAARALLDSPVHHWLLKVSCNVRIAVVDNYEDLLCLVQAYPLPAAPELSLLGPSLHWEALAEDYDALHLTHSGMLATRHLPRGGDLGPSLMGWDCESTLWFRWSFSEVHDLGPLALDRLG